MLGDISVANDIYIVCGYTDMRKSIDGLRFTYSVDADVTVSKHCSGKQMVLYFCISVFPLRESTAGQEINQRSVHLHGNSSTG